MRLFLLITCFLFALSFAQEQSDADKRASILGTVHVSKIHSLDEVKGTYKSPRKAMFMSLLVPGSGQFYVGNRQSRYVRGAFYLAEEIALISGLYYHSIYKYDKQVKKYQNYAKENFSVGRYEEKMNGISKNDEIVELFQSVYGSEREDYCKAIYGPAIGGSGSKCHSFSTGFDEFYRNNYIEGMSFYDPAGFYRAIASENFMLGWEDAVLDPMAETEINQGNFISLGTSEQYGNYISMRKRANTLADRQAIFLGAIILNHIVSAVDAALSAKAHNNSLYEEKLSFLDRIRLGSDFHIGENFRAGAGLWYYF